MSDAVAHSNSLTELYKKGPRGGYAHTKRADHHVAVASIPIKYHTPPHKPSTVSIDTYNTR